MTRDTFQQTRRAILRTTATLLAMGGAGTAAPAEYPAWDPTTLYTVEDRVSHDGSCWEATIDSRNAEPTASSAYWKEISCDGSGNTSPTASFTVSPSSPAPGESVTFDASGSSDSDGTISSYEWDFTSDGSVDATGQSATHSYDSAGDYTVELTVTDDAGATASISTTVSVQNDSGNSSPTASFTVSPSSPAPGESVTFDASGSSDSDGTISSYEWDFTSDGTVDATGQTATHTYDSEGTYTVDLTITDDGGASDSTTTTLSVGETSSEFKIIGYYPGWKATPEYDYYPEDIPWGKVTDVKYAFLGVDPQNGVPTIMSDQDQQNLETFKELKSGPAADTRIHVSVGGWADSEGFSQIAASESKRQSFAQRAVEIVRQYDLDGVDIDWEHPGSQQGKCQCGSNEDYVTHIDLLQAIRDALDAAEAEDGRKYWLSVANGGSDWNAGGLRHGEIGEICDYAMIMSYDFTGSWMDVAGLNAPLYGDAHPTNSAQYGETYHDQYYLEYSVDELWAGDHDETAYWPGQWEYPPAPPADHGELVLGLPFYGRGFNGTELYGSYSGLPEGTWHHVLEDGADPTGVFDFGDLEANFIGTDGWERSYHQPGAVPYLVNTDQNTIISYDDEQSIAEKVAFAKERGMQGVMFWELAQDYNETLLDTINQTV